MQFEFSTASRIIFGSGKISTIASLISHIGDRVLVVSGAPDQVTNKLMDLIDLPGIYASLVKIEHEPTVDSIRFSIGQGRATNPGVVIGIGGGSAIDTAKATAAMLSNPGDVTDYLEIIGQGKNLEQPSVPMIAIPTTAGTGSEVTKNAVIGSPAHKVKVSLRSAYLIPRIALVDPELTLSVPRSTTATSGLDALTQLIEAYTCNSPNPMTNPLCVEGVQNAADSLYQVYDDGNNLQAREQMALAALFSGLALANARLGAVHGLAGPIGGLIDAPHGAICASLLANVMHVNISKLLAMNPEHPTLARFSVIGRILAHNPDATTDMGIEWISNFCMHAEIKPLSAYGFSVDQMDEIIEKALKSSSMKGNSVTLNPNDLRNILKMSI